MTEEIETLFEGKFLRLLKEGRWEYVDRVNANGAVMIIAVTPENELILVEEYRYPLHAWTIGLPAGISGDEGPEPHLSTAKRELKEEAGYTADKWTFVCEGPSSPGLTTEMVSFYRAEFLTRVSSGGGVDNENIRAHLVPLPEIKEWLDAQRRSGRIIDPKIYMGLYFVHAHKEEEPI